MNAEELTNERKKTNGCFRDSAWCIQELKGILHHCLRERRVRQQDDLTCQQIEALDMILHKIGRIVAGDPNFQDHWDDIAGYAHIANKDYSNEKPTGTKT